MFAFSESKSVKIGEVELFAIVAELPSASKALMALEICAALTDPVLFGSSAVKSLLASDVVPPSPVTKVVNSD